MSFLKFIFAMFLSFLPGFLGVIVTPMETGGNAWYNTLQHSVLTPAGWVFSVAWSVLYFLIGLALYFIMQTHVGNGGYTKTMAYWLFAVNLVLNTLWSFVFFGAQMPSFALLVLVALIIVVILMAREFYRINRVSFWLILPYILWLFFALYLNGMIIYLN
jgi:tryptophan-rich sensory protein